MIADLKPYPEYREDGPVWCERIPSGWQSIRNGRLFRERNQTGFADLPVLEVSLRTGVRVRDLEAGSRKQVMWDFSKYKRARCGDIAYNMMRMWQGAIGVVPTDGLVSPAYVVAKPFSDVRPRYYSFLFRTAAYTQQIDAFSRGIVKDRNRLYWDAFKQMPSLSPPPDEQALIVRFLDWASVRLSKVIAAKRKVIGLLDEQKQAIIHRAVTRGLDENVPLKPSGLDWLGDVPEHWEIGRLTRYITKIEQGWSPVASNEKLADDQWAVLALSSINRGTFDATAIKPIPTRLAVPSRMEIKEGDILMTRANTRKRVGDVTMVTGPRQYTILSDLIYRLTVRQSDVYPSFLVFQLLSRIGRFQIETDARGSSDTMPKISQKHISSWSVVIPELPEQKLIVAEIQSRLKDVNRVVDSVFKEITLLHEYQTRLISDVVTGKLDVRELARSLPADVSEEAAEMAASEPTHNDFATNEELVEEVR